MSEKTKKILLITGFTLVVIGVGTLIWLVFFKKEAPQAAAEKERALLPQSGALPARKPAEERRGCT